MTDAFALIAVLLVVIALLAGVLFAAGDPMKYFDDDET